MGSLPLGGESIGTCALRISDAMPPESKPTRSPNEYPSSALDERVRPVHGFGARVELVGGLRMTTAPGFASRDLLQFSGAHGSSYVLNERPHALVRTAVGALTTVMLVAEQLLPAIVTTQLEGACDHGFAHAIDSSVVRV